MLMTLTSSSLTNLSMSVRHLVMHGSSSPENEILARLCRCISSELHPSSCQGLVNSLENARFTPSDNSRNPGVVQDNKLSCSPRTAGHNRSCRFLHYYYHRKNLASSGASSGSCPGKMHINECTGIGINCRLELKKGQITLYDWSKKNPLEPVVWICL